MADRFFGNALHSRPAGNEMVERAAFGACLRPLFMVPAMVADQLAAKPMFDQPARTVRALEAVAAYAAERERRITATVQEEQCLFPTLQGSLNMADEYWRQEAAAWWRRAAHVD